MVNRVISLPEEINNQLKEEKNASGLIAELLYGYFENSSVEELEKKIEGKVEEKLKLETRREKIIKHLVKILNRTPTKEEIDKELESFNKTMKKLEDGNQA